MRKILILLPLFALTACVNVNTDEKEKTGPKETTAPKSKIRNGIELESHGLKVEQAYLQYEDNSLVPEDNRTEVNKQILCKLIISDGWKDKDGVVFPGASERIETNTGQVLLNEPDLFKSYETQGVKKEDAAYITLSANISKLDKLFDYFIVKFKLWDKTSGSYVNGTFKFYIK